ncbi:MAG TPA: hypothetical protein PKE57_00890 [Cellvibrionaceae bacterium]|nr:hypothetical protein [Cellvibrionaceae bacterium]HMW47804.1 hypothetical protein [Cellvibrionaceae bacterium]
MTAVVNGCAETTPLLSKVKADTTPPPTTPFTAAPEMLTVGVSPGGGSITVLVLLLLLLQPQP